MKIYCTKVQYETRDIKRLNNLKVITRRDIKKAESNDSAFI